VLPHTAAHAALQQQPTRLLSRTCRQPSQLWPHTLQALLMMMMRARQVHAQLLQWQRTVSLLQWPQQWVPRTQLQQS
jgi:hypothetical protein